MGQPTQGDNSRIGSRRSQDVSSPSHPIYYRRAIAVNNILNLAKSANSAGGRNLNIPGAVAWEVTVGLVLLAFKVIVAAMDFAQAP